MTGAGIVFWKKENNKIYVLMAKRKYGYGKNHYSTFGGHREKIDYENGKLNFLNTAIRESAEETSIIPDDGSQASMDKAKAYFAAGGFKLNTKSIRKIHFPYYHYYTFECEVTEKSKWYSESYEHYKGTMKWFPIDDLPEPVLFAAKINIMQIKNRI